MGDPREGQHDHRTTCRPPLPAPVARRNRIPPAGAVFCRGSGLLGYHKALKTRQVQMIAIGGAIGTGLFMGAGGRLASAGPALVFIYAQCWSSSMRCADSSDSWCYVHSVNWYCTDRRRVRSCPTPHLRDTGARPGNRVQPDHRQRGLAAQRCVSASSTSGRCCCSACFCPTPRTRPESVLSSRSSGRSAWTAPTPS